MAGIIAPTQKLRLLCLHGYTQNAEVFRTRLGSLRKALKSRVEFVFLDAPFLVGPAPLAGDSLSTSDADANGDAPAQQGRSWWEWTDGGTVERPSQARTYSGWEETSKPLIEAAMRQHAPVHGLLGFSQGATAVALMVASQPSEQEQRSHEQQLLFSIMIAGFVPKDPCYEGVLSRASSSSIPALFVQGLADTAVTPERGQDLLQKFNPAVASSFTHPGGHMVPTATGLFKDTLLGFVDAAALSQSSTAKELHLAA
ncbi:MAG: hypothetical protein WDW36_004581 [Sanguina aurantia]